MYTGSIDEWEATRPVLMFPPENACIRNEQLGVRGGWALFPFVKGPNICKCQYVMFAGATLGLRSM